MNKQANAARSGCETAPPPQKQTRLKKGKDERNGGGEGGVCPAAVPTARARLGRDTSCEANTASRARRVRVFCCRTEGDGGERTRARGRTVRAPRACRAGRGYVYYAVTACWALAFFSMGFFGFDFTFVCQLFATQGIAFFLSFYFSRGSTPQQRGTIGSALGAPS